MVTEYLISYDGAPWMFTVSIMQFRVTGAATIGGRRVHVLEGAGDRSGVAASRVIG